MALSVSAVPESLPVAISVVLVLGMRRMAARKALVRNMRAIETLGALTTIATDKTGTLTKNKLTAQETWQPASSSDDIALHVQKTINQGSHKTHDPLDSALIGNVWKQGDGLSVAIKGAPEQILHHSNLTEYEREEATAALHKLTSQGYR